MHNLWSINKIEPFINNWFKYLEWITLVSFLVKIASLTSNILISIIAGLSVLLLLIYFTGILMEYLDLRLEKICGLKYISPIIVIIIGLLFYQALSSILTTILSN